ncbi:MAG: hypothetical protein R3F19_34565 [Verrucomicrobiales bacterium]
MLLLFWLIAAGVRSTGDSNPEIFPDQRTVWGVVLSTVALQIVVGIVTIHLLRRKPLWVYALVGLGFGIMIAAFSGKISLFGTGAESAAADENGTAKFDLPMHLGMLGLTIPAMVAAYVVCWWRFTLVPHNKRLRSQHRRQRGRKSREEIANTSLAGHQRVALPEDRKPRVPRQRRS